MMLMFMFMKAYLILAAAGGRRQLLTTAFLPSAMWHHQQQQGGSCSFPSGSASKEMMENESSTSTAFVGDQQQHYSQSTNFLPRSSPHTDATTFPTSIQARMQDLISHPAVVWDESSTFASMHKKRLGRRHLPLFDRAGGADDTICTDKSPNAATNNLSCHDHLFDKFAQTVCDAGVVARKEVFETWASALYIYSSFLMSNEEEDASGGIQPIRRVADIAAGHGLLAWALLILDDEHQRKNDARTKNNDDDDESSHHPPPLTAFCLDVQMPPSAERIHSSMTRQWPELEERFAYVEGRLEQLVPHSSCLLASVHACGILSDVLVATAAEYGVPLAVVPCCHSRKPKVLEVASPFAKTLYDDIILNTKGGSLDLSDRLDEARIVALENAGLDVKEVFLPTIFTGKNRLIMGFPSNAERGHSLTETLDNQQNQPAVTSTRKGQMPPLDKPTSIMPKQRFLKGFYVPCEDNEANRQLVSKLAGRAAANNRKDVMHNRNHTKTPQMDLSLWLPEEEEDVCLSEDALSRIVESKHSVKCTVSKLGSIYINPSGRRSQTFRFRYESGDDTSILSFDDAKRMQDELYDIVPKAFPGVECR